MVWKRMDRSQMPALSLRLFNRCGCSLTSRLQGCLRMRHFGLEIQVDGSRIWQERPRVRPSAFYRLLECEGPARRKPGLVGAGTR